MSASTGKVDGLRQSQESRSRLPQIARRAAWKLGQNLIFGRWHLSRKLYSGKPRWPEKAHEWTSSLSGASRPSSQHDCDRLDPIEDLSAKAFEVMPRDEKSDDVTDISESRSPPRSGINSQEHVAIRQRESSVEKEPLLRQPWVQSSSGVSPIALHEFGGIFVCRKDLETLFYNLPLSQVTQLRAGSQPRYPGNGDGQTCSPLEPPISCPSVLPFKATQLPGESSNSDQQLSLSSNTSGSRRQARPNAGASRKGKGRRTTSRGGKNGGTATNGTSEGGETGDDDSKWLWVCPFFRIDPYRYGLCLWRCTKRDIPHLKQHLMLDHKASGRPRCPRCYQEFRGQLEMEEHVREQTCTQAPERPPDGLTDDQIDHLNTLRPRDSIEGYDMLFDVAAERIQPKPFKSNRPAWITQEELPRESLYTHTEVYLHAISAVPSIGLQPVAHGRHVAMIDLHSAITAVVDIRNFYDGTPVLANPGRPSTAPGQDIPPLTNHGVPHQQALGFQSPASVPSLRPGHHVDGIRTSTLASAPGDLARNPPSPANFPPGRPEYASNPSLAALLTPFNPQQASGNGQQNNAGLGAGGFHWFGQGNGPRQPYQHSVNSGIPDDAAGFNQPPDMTMQTPDLIMGGPLPTQQQWVAPTAGYPGQVSSPSAASEPSEWNDAGSTASYVGSQLR